ncbi:hypothetical protein H2200_000927 [Cladophialophora chaetospira]|uniref:Manganese lipoxygenase n=1 Tax=Cladophialophora chaetospira TaxID=386627 RepID=A0AA38XPS0_9EURO|nr:hypothetical protein H2200_000927 [Cladophialophora chaetospira]
MYLTTLLLLANIYTTISAQTSNDSSSSYVLPLYDPAPLDRRQRVAKNQQGYLYGESLLGNLSFFPTGQLGDALVAKEASLWTSEAELFESIVHLEAQEVATALLKVSNASTTPSTSSTQELASFFALYRNQWQDSNPDGLDVGAYTNFTQDLYFSMERLSVNPFSLSRISPNQTLPFKLANNVTMAITGTTLSKLQLAGRMFVVDHSDFADLPRQPGKYSASSTAFFFIHPESGDFLPLAIKTNEGADLIYTPLDSANDWFLAKTLFESNEAVFVDMFHLSATHAVAEIVHQAALRTMADQHPIRGLLDLIMYRAYAVRLAGSTSLFNAGGLVDQNFAFNASTVLGWNSRLYQNVLGRFQTNYFERWFTDHGLINSSYGPALTHFPFYEDVKPVVDSMRVFIEAFVRSYYPTDDLISQDTELQAWIVEANGPAQVLDFPPAPLTSRTTLVDILTHMTYLTGVLHHALNSGAYAASWHLPLHPIAHYQPLPTSKGVKSVLPFLPNATHAINQIALLNSFNRPSYKYDGLNLPALFSNPTFLARANNDTQAAAARFQTSLTKLSAVNQAKSFDRDGLSQGMPFIWRTVDPMRLPSFLSM